MDREQLKRKFPVSCGLLQDRAASTIVLFEKFLQSLDEPESFRWFPRFLKSEKYPSIVWQAAQVEFTLGELASLENPTASQTTGLRMAQHLDIQFISEDIKPLGLSTGLYAFYKNGSEIRRHCLTKAEAFVLDILSESIDFSFQLTEVSIKSRDFCALSSSSTSCTAEPRGSARERRSETLTCRLY